MGQDCFVEEEAIRSLPPEVPQQGNAFTRGLGRLVLALLGWRLVGTIPNQKKMILCVAPHTSNWDFVLGIATYLALGLKANWFGKHTIFRWPFGWLLRSLGGIPVQRRNKHGFVGQMVEQFHQRDHLVFALAPEGTRKPTETFKTGFYHIGLGANVPLVPVGMDYRKKSLVFGPALMPTGDYEGQCREMMSFFRAVVPRKPDHFIVNCP
jgi:1-acyl-sn-glycerol-3-phosphate acyltransferase